MKRVRPEDGNRSPIRECCSSLRLGVSAGIVRGKGNGILDPRGAATRAEVAQIVMNYDTIMNAPAEKE